MLVINVLSCRNPLYTVEIWADSLPLDLLWGGAVQADQLNDDALGRVLEDVASYGPQLLATLGTRMQAVDGTGNIWCHTDTSAFALFGDYPSASTGPTAPIVLTRGHSKDHRPDLKQIMVGMTTDEDGSILLYPWWNDALGQYLGPHVEYPMGQATGRGFPRGLLAR